MSEDAAPLQQEIVAKCHECGDELYRSAAHHHHVSTPRVRAYLGAVKKAAKRHTAETGHAEVGYSGQLVYDS